MIRRRGQLLTKTLDTEAEAIAWATIEEARLVKGVTPAQIKATPGTTTVADLFDRYTREVSPQKEGERWEVIRFRKLAPDFQMAAANGCPCSVADA